MDNDKSNIWMGVIDPNTGEKIPPFECSTLTIGHCDKHGPHSAGVCELCVAELESGSFKAPQVL